jgi:hypothetical protein
MSGLIDGQILIVINDLLTQITAVFASEGKQWKRHAH